MATTAIASSSSSPTTTTAPTAPVPASFTTIPASLSYASIAEDRRRVQMLRDEAAHPSQPLESMTRAQAHISKLRTLTQAITALMPTNLKTSSMTSLSMRSGNNSSSDQRDKYGLQLLEPVIPPDREAFLLQLSRSAVTGDDLRDKYERIQKDRTVESMHLSSKATPPSGDYKHVLQGKVESFQSHNDRIQRIASLTPRSLLKQRMNLAPGSPRRGDEDEDVEEDANKKSAENVRNMAESLAATKTNELLEKSIVLQASKQDVQGNLSLKRAVQLAMAAQHTQEIENMKRVFEQRLNEAVRAAKAEGYVLGRNEGTSSSKQIMDSQAATITELKTTVDRLQTVAQQSFVTMEATNAKVQFVRDEKQRWIDLFHKYEGVDLNDVVQRATMYESERQYLYSQAMRTVPDFDALVFGSKSFHMHPTTAKSTPVDAYRSPARRTLSSLGSSGGGGSGQAANAGGRNVLAAKAKLRGMQSLHEALSRQMLAMYDNKRYL